MKRTLYLCLFGFIAACISGCGGSKEDGETCEEGTLGCPCINGWTCDIGLTCSDDICVEKTDASDTGQEQDTGTGQAQDTGTGQAQDTGTGQAQDSDTGTTDLDGGTVDGGADGGVGDAESCHKDVKGWSADFATVEETFLTIVNQKRQAGAMCGGVSYTPSTQLVMAPSLRCADRYHVYDMHNRNYNPQDNPDQEALCELGATSPARAASAGFTGVVTGWGWYKETASDPTTAQELVDQLLSDAGNCKNLMLDSAKYLGVGYASYPPESGNLSTQIWSYSIGKD